MALKLGVKFIALLDTQLQSHLGQVKFSPKSFKSLGQAHFTPFFQKSSWRAAPKIFARPSRQPRPAMRQLRQPWLLWLESSTSKLVFFSPSTLLLNPLWYLSKTGGLFFGSPSVTRKRGRMSIDNAFWRKIRLPKYNVVPIFLFSKAFFIFTTLARLHGLCRWQRQLLELV